MTDIITTDDRGQADRGRTGQSTRDQSKSDQSGAEFRRALGVLALIIGAAGGLATLLYALQFARAETLSVLGAAAAVAGAATAVGSFIGFLFGIPKTLQSDRQDGAETRYIANTNLEQISDWLTKILVGVGLVQISAAPEALGHLAQQLGPLFGGKDTSPAFGLSLAIYFTVSGFVVAYLWTRAVLQSVLKAADRDVAAQIQDVLSKREGANAQALALVERQLTGQSAPTQEELNEAISAATPEWLVQIYRRAEEQRRRNWRNDPATMEQTIPVFRALAAADPRRNYFRHFGSLGFALKDKAQPLYEEALAALTTAIDVRGKPRTKGVLIYEWNRAVCRIHLDASFAAGKASSDTDKQPILADLKAAAEQLSARMFEGAEDPDTITIGKWLGLNELTYSDLRSQGS